MIRGVLFDKDDTLLDLATFWLAPIRHTVDFALRELGQENNTPLRHALEEACGFDGETLIAESPVVAGTNADVIGAMMAVLAERGITTENDVLFARLCETYLEYACLRDGTAQPTGNLHAVLDALHAQNIFTGVATSDSYASTIHALEKMGIANKIDAVFTADRIAHPKPAPDMAEHFCTRFALTANEVAMVGDSAGDMQFARNAGLLAIYFDHNTAPANVDCDHRITHIEDVIALLCKN